MNLIDLLWIAIFVGGGAVIGDRLYGGYGLLAGAVAGAVALWLIARTASKPWSKTDQ